MFLFDPQISFPIDEKLQENELTVEDFLEDTSVVTALKFGSKRVLLLYVFFFKIISFSS